MAAAADPSSSSPSPRAAGGATRNPWSHVVRGEPEAAVSPSSPSSPPPAAIPSPEPSDRSPRKPPPEDVAPSSSPDAARGKKQAWKRPPNGSVEAGAAVIGGAASWPALSESAKASPKSSSSDALKPLSDGPLSALPAHTISTSSPKPNLNPSSSPNHVAPARQKSMKRGGGDSSSGDAADGGVALPSPPPTSSPVPLANSDKQAPPELSPRDQTTKNTANWEHGSRVGGLGSRAHDGGDHFRSYGGNRRWNNGGGAGSHHNNYSNRRDQERGGYDGYCRNAGGRDVHMQQRGARPYLRPPAPPVTPPFLSPPPQLRPFGNPMVLPDMPSPIFYVATQPPPGGVPFVPHPAVPPAMFISAIDPQRAGLLKQIDYYFSSENLCKDVYLRQNMDEQGWVPISLIAGFNRVRHLTNSIEFILETLRLSTVVEVQGDKVRKRNDWMNWVLPPSNNQFANISNQSPATPNSDNLAARSQSFGLVGAADRNITRVPRNSEVFLSRSASGNLSNQFQVAVNHNRDDNSQVIGLSDSDWTQSGRSLVRSDTL